MINTYIKEALVISTSLKFSFGVNYIGANYFYIL